MSVTNTIYKQMLKVNFNVHIKSCLKSFTKAFVSLLIFVLGIPFAETIKAQTFSTQATISDGLAFFGIPNYLVDINNDGYDDLVASSYKYNSTFGRIYIYYGGPTFNSNPVITVTNNVSPSNFGYDASLAIPADIDNDNKLDLIIGDYYQSSYSGKTFVFLNSSLQAGDNSVANADYVGIGNQTDEKYFGASVKVADLNGDGFNDIIVGALTSNMATDGRLLIFLNNNGSFDLESPDKILDPTQGSTFGYLHLDTGDFNGDGLEDILSFDIQSASGRDGIIFLQQEGFDFTEKYIVTQAPDNIGRNGSVSVGDIDLDGKDDFCTGSQGHNNNTGRVICWKGSSNLPDLINYSDAFYTEVGEAEKDNFGRAVLLHDVTNDGFLDLLVGAYQTSNTAGQKHGKMYIYLGNGATISDTPWYKEVKTSGNKGFGNLISAGDIDNDGMTDLAIFEGGSASGGTGQSNVVLMELDHGNPQITYTPLATFTTSTTLNGNASDSNGYTISGVQWSTGDNPQGSWNDCVSSDGSFNTAAEEFTCNLGDLSNGTYNLYIRSRNQYQVYMPERSYIHISSFTLDTKSPKGLKLGLSKDKLYKPQEKSLTLNTRRAKLYFNAKDITTSVEKIKVSEHKDFRKANWKRLRWGYVD
jgi:hypothetical protein